MFNAKRMLDQLVQTVQGAATSINTKSSQSQGGMFSNPALTGALSGAGGGLLAGMLLGNQKTRKITGKVASLGGAAALGGLALNAYRNWQTNKSTATGVTQQNIPQQPQPVTLEFDNLTEAKQEDHSRAMLTAIIAAAKADGHFDERERQIIQEQTASMDDPEAKTWIQQEINKPLDVNQIAALATSPELAAEIYLASLIVIAEQNESEKIYLNSLAEKLGLEPQLRMEIEQQLVS